MNIYSNHLMLKQDGQLKGNNQDYIEYRGKSEVGVTAKSEGGSITYDCGCSPEEMRSNPDCFND
jgi:hypothetical protein